MKCDYKQVLRPNQNWPLYRCRTCGDTVEIRKPKEQHAATLNARPACGVERDRDRALLDKLLRAAYSDVAKCGFNKHEEFDRRRDICLTCEDWIPADADDPPTILAQSGCRIANPPELRYQRTDTRQRYATTCFRTCVGQPDKWEASAVLAPRSPGTCLRDAVIRWAGSFPNTSRGLLEKMDRWGRRACLGAKKDSIIGTMMRESRRRGWLKRCKVPANEAVRFITTLVENAVMESAEPEKPKAATSPVAAPPTIGMIDPVPHGIDVVYTLGAGSKWGDNELRYSLRSLEKNFPDLGRVFIVGHKPDWAVGVVHIPMEDVHKHNKDANIIDKVLAACNAGVTEQFVFCSDDQLFASPVRFADMRAFHIGDLKDKPDSFWGGGSWKNRLKATRDVLAAHGLPTLHYDSHVPTPYSREAFIKAASRFDYKPGSGYTINTLCCNAAGVKGEPLGKRKLTIEKAGNDTERMRNDMRGKWFLGYNDAGLTDELKDVLGEMFPDKSRFESDAYTPPLSRVADGLRRTQNATTMRLWSLWEGPKPPFVELCQETLLRHNPGAKILNLAEFCNLQTFDKDVDFSHLHMPHKSDWIRLYLLKAFGGMWIDADCIVMRPLGRFVDALRCCWSMTYYERSGHIGGGFMGAPPDSYHINEAYQNAKELVQSKKQLRWRELLGENLESVLLKHHYQGFFKCDWHQFIPVPFHRKWGAFFRQGTDAEHQANFNNQAYTYMLSHNSFPRNLHSMTKEEILSGDYFISYVFRKALSS